jgi:hypothetical protein
LKVFQWLAQSITDVLFAEPREIALAVVARAAVGDVLSLLNVPGELAAIMGTGHETSEGNVALRVS